MRVALADAMGARDQRALSQLAGELAARASRPAHAASRPPGRVMIGREGAQGPSLGYLLRPDGSGCWLALGWRPVAEAAAVRDTLPVDVEDSFRLGPLPEAAGDTEPFGAVVVSVEYRAGSLPDEHRLLNDLHAMVMLGDVLAEQASPAPPAAR